MKKNKNEERKKKNGQVGGDFCKLFKLLILFWIRKNANFY